MIVPFTTVSLTLWLRCNQLMIKLSLLVMPMLITVSDWSQSLPLVNMAMMLLIVVICQVVSSWSVVLLTLLVINSIL